MGKIKSLKVKQQSGEFGNSIPIGADATNIDIELVDKSVTNLQNVVGGINLEKGDIAAQLNGLEEFNSTVIDELNTLNNSIKAQPITDLELKELRTAVGETVERPTIKQGILGSIENSGVLVSPEMPTSAPWIKIWVDSDSNEEVNLVTAEEFEQYTNIFTSNVEESVGNWLEAHPDATTSVGPGSIGETHLSSEVVQKLNSVPALDTLPNVEINSPIKGQVLSYDNTNNSEKWKNVSLDLTTDINGLTDTAISSPTDGQVLAYNDGNWENTTLEKESLDTLQNVTINSPTDGQVLTYNLSNNNWKNQTLTIPTKVSELNNDENYATIANVPFIQSGKVSVTDVKANKVKSFKVSFGESFKAGTTPIVVLTPVTEVPQNIRFGVLNVDNSKFFIELYRTTAKSTNFNWIAIGKRS